MTHLPAFADFSRHASQGRLVPVYRQLVSDTLTPVTAYHKIQRGGCSFLFESVVGGERIGRYSFLGSNPFMTVEAYRNELVIQHGNAEPERRQVDDPLNELETMLQDYQAVHLPGLPRFCGGAVGYAGYDVVRYTEHLPGCETKSRWDLSSFAWC